MAFYWANDADMAEKAEKQQKAENKKIKDKRVYWPEEDKYLEFRKLLYRREWAEIGATLPDISGWDACWLKYRIEVLICEGHTLATMEEGGFSPSRLEEQLTSLSKQLGLALKRLRDSELAPSIRLALATELDALSKESATRQSPPSNLDRFNERVARLHPPRTYSAPDVLSKPIIQYWGASQVNDAVGYLGKLKLASDRAIHRQTRVASKNENKGGPVPHEARRAIYIGLFQLYNQLAAMCEGLEPMKLEIDETMRRDPSRELLRGPGADFIRACRPIVNRVHRRLVANEEAIGETFIGWSGENEPESQVEIP